MSIVFTLLSNKSQSQFGVVKATESYLEVTKTWRVKGTIPKILSSNNGPHQVQKLPVAGYIKSSLGESDT